MRTHWNAHVRNGTIGPAATPAIPVCEACDDSPAEYRFNVTDLQGTLLATVQVCWDCAKHPCEIGLYVGERDDKLTKEVRG